MVDVARRAGVSIATVSRVIEGTYPVAEETRANVLRCIDELQFEVNRNARNLKLNQSHMVGVVVADISNSYFMKMAKGLEDVIEPAGYTMVCASSDENPIKEQQLLRSLRQYRIDGMVLASCYTDAEMFNSMFAGTLNCVMVDNPIPGVHADTVTENDREAMCELVSHVIKSGHRRIAIFNGDLRIPNGYNRSMGYLDAYAKHGLEADERYIVEAHFKKQEALEKCRLLLEDVSKPRPTAIIAASNLMMEGVLIALREKNVKIPEDISVASFNELNCADLFRPVITHLQDNTFEIGRTAGKLLLERIEDKKSAGPLIPLRAIQMKKLLFPGESVRKL